MKTAHDMESLNPIDEAIQSLIRGDGKELDAFLTKIVINQTINETKSKIHCYMVSFDGQDRPRVKDLIRAITERVVDYAIPRSEVKRAWEHALKHNTNSEVTKLTTKAKQLFTSIKKTGEGAEMLLYMMTQSFLGIPQLLSKMSLKTNSQLHYNGADGIHLMFDKSINKLCLYWGESKLYQSIDDGVTDCLDSIRPFLCDEGGTETRQMRDLQLINDNLDLCDDDLEAALLKFLDPEDPCFNQLQYRGICLIGYDHDSYPGQPFTKTQQKVMQEIETSIEKWKKSIGTKLKNRSPLELFQLEVFLVPFPSVQEFRDHFIKEMSL
jgi:hypothetical protein